MIDNNSLEPWLNQIDLAIYEWKCSGSQICWFLEGQELWSFCLILHQISGRMWVAPWWSSSRLCLVLERAGHSSWDSIPAWVCIQVSPEWLPSWACQHQNRYRIWWLLEYCCWYWTVSCMVWICLGISFGAHCSSRRQRSSQMNKESWTRLLLASSLRWGIALGPHCRGSCHRLGEVCASSSSRFWRIIGLAISRSRETSLWLSHLHQASGSSAPGSLSHKMQNALGFASDEASLLPISHASWSKCFDSFRRGLPIERHYLV